MAPGLGEQLKRARRAAGLTQEALAERAGLSVATISLLERGQGHMPRADTLALLADALGLTPPERARMMALGRADLAGVAPTMPGRRAVGSEAVPFVGRTAELAALERHVRGVDGPAVLALAGEPGIGKSRLLGEAAALGTRAGRVVLAGGCRQRGGQEPYAPLSDALLRHLRRLSTAQARAQLVGCAWLILLLPELAGGPIEPLPPWTVSPLQERQLMFAAVTRLLTNAAGSAGTLLLLDDLQWAGPDALDLVRVLVVDGPAAGLRVVAAYRDTEPPAGPLEELLADLAHAGAASYHLVAPLPPDDAAHLLDALLGADSPAMAAHAQVVRRTGGVPFFLVSWAQGWRAPTLGAAEEGEEDTGRVPWSVGQSVRQRMAVLSPAARALLGLAAVAGREVPLRLLLAMEGMSRAEALVALETACQARLLEETGTATYRFAHDLIREVVEDGLSAARRAELHRLIATALEEGPGAPPVEQLAYHYAQASEPARAAAWLEQAGDQAAGRGASATALVQYAAAREQLVLSASAPADLSRLDEKLGDLHLLTGASPQAAEEFARARAAEGNLARRVELRRKEGLCSLRQGIFDKALQILAAAEAEGSGLHGVATVPAGVRAAIELSRGDVYVRALDLEAAEAAAERALTLLGAEPPGPLRTRAEATADRLLHSVAFTRQNMVLAETFAQQGLARSRQLGDQEGLGWWWKSLGFVAWNCGQPDRAEEYFRRGLLVAEEIGDQERASECWRGLGYAAADRREFGHADDCLWRSLASAERIGSPWQLARTWLGLAHLSRERGRLDEGIERLRRSVTLFEPLTHPDGLVLPRVSLGWCLWRTGDLTGAEECLRHEAVAREGSLWTDNLTRVFVGLGGVLRDQGKPTDALRWLRLARRGTRRSGFLHLEVEATVEQGRTHLLARRWRAASGALARATYLASLGGAAAAMAHVHLLEAAVHLHEGRLAEAQMAAEAALRRASADEACRVERLSVVAFGQGRPLQGLALRLLGVCALRRCVPDEAAAHLRAALAVHLELGMALEAARTRRLLAETLMAMSTTGEHSAEARTHLGAALAQFAASGAALDLGLAQQMAAAWQTR